MVFLNASTVTGQFTSGATASILSIMVVNLYSMVQHSYEWQFHVVEEKIMTMTNPVSFMFESTTAHRAYYTAQHAAA